MFVFVNLSFSFNNLFTNYFIWALFQLTKILIVIVLVNNNKNAIRIQRGDFLLKEQTQKKESVVHESDYTSCVVC